MKIPVKIKLHNPLSLNNFAITDERLYSVKQVTQKYHWKFLRPQTNPLYPTQFPILLFNSQCVKSGYAVFKGENSLWDVLYTGRQLHQHSTFFSPCFKGENIIMWLYLHCNKQTNIKGVLLDSELSRSQRSCSTRTAAENTGLKVTVLPLCLDLNVKVNYF